MGTPSPSTFQHRPRRPPPANRCSISSSHSTSPSSRSRLHQPHRDNSSLSCGGPGPSPSPFSFPPTRSRRRRHWRLSATGHRRRRPTCTTILITPLRPATISMTCSGDRWWISGAIPSVCHPTTTTSSSPSSSPFQVTSSTLRCQASPMLRLPPLPTPRIIRLRSTRRTSPAVRRRI